MAPFSTSASKKTKNGQRKHRRFPIKRPIPVRMLIPNLITLMGLTAGLTAIRMGIEHRYELGNCGDIDCRCPLMPLMAGWLEC